MTEHKHAAVIIAWAEGKAVQYRQIEDSKWYDMEDDIRFPSPNFNSSEWDWRIKPEPRTPRRIWMHKALGAVSFDSREEAIKCAELQGIPGDRLLEFVEVLDE